MEFETGNGRQMLCSSRDVPLAMQLAAYILGGKVLGTQPFFLIYSYDAVLLLNLR